MELAQFIANKATRKLLEYSDMQRYAGDVDMLLNELLSPFMTADGSLVRQRVIGRAAGAA